MKKVNSYSVFSPSSYYFAFTLAEVLITLAVIGVVAAMTMPVITNKVNDKVLESQEAKAKSILVNGYNNLLAKEEIFDVKDFSLVFCEDIDCVVNLHKDSFQIIKDSTAGPNAYDNLPQYYMIQNQPNTKSLFSWSDVPYIFTTNDGMTYGLIPDDDMKSLSLYVDINDSKNPNITSKDLYKFRYSGIDKLADVSFELDKIETCSLETPSACKTSEACLALNSHCAWTYWSHETCHILSNYCR